VIINAGGGDIGVPQPLLDFRDVSLIIERIGSGCRAQRMSADLKAQLRRIRPHQPIHPVRCKRSLKRARAIVFDRPKQGTVLIGAVSRRLEVLVDQGVGSRMQPAVASIPVLKC